MTRVTSGFIVACTFSFFPLVLIVTVVHAQSNTNCGGTGAICSTTKPGYTTTVSGSGQQSSKETDTTCTEQIRQQQANRGEKVCTPDCPKATYNSAGGGSVTCYSDSKNCQKKDSGIKDCSDKAMQDIITGVTTPSGPAGTQGGATTLQQADQALKNANANVAQAQQNYDNCHWYALCDSSTAQANLDQAKAQQAAAQQSYTDKLNQLAGQGAQNSGVSNPTTNTSGVQGAQGTPSGATTQGNYTSGCGAGGAICNSSGNPNNPSSNYSGLPPNGQGPVSLPISQQVSEFPSTDLPNYGSPNSGYFNSSPASTFGNNIVPNYGQFSEPFQSSFGPGSAYSGNGGYGASPTGYSGTGLTGSPSGAAPISGITGSGVSPTGYGGIPGFNGGPSGGVPYLGSPDSFNYAPGQVPGYLPSAGTLTVPANTLSPNDLVNAVNNTPLGPTSLFPGIAGNANSNAEAPFKFPPDYSLPPINGYGTNAPTGELGGIPTAGVANSIQNPSGSATNGTAPNGRPETIVQAVNQSLSDFQKVIRGEMSATDAMQRALTNIGVGAEQELFGAPMGLTAGSGFFRPVTNALSSLGSYLNTPFSETKLGQTLSTIGTTLTTPQQPATIENQEVPYNPQTDLLGTPNYTATNANRGIADVTSASNPGTESGKSAINPASLTGNSSDYLNQGAGTLYMDKAAAQAANFSNLVAAQQEALALNAKDNIVATEESIRANQNPVERALDAAGLSPSFNGATPQQRADILANQKIIAGAEAASKFNDAFMNCMQTCAHPDAVIALMPPPNATPLQQANWQIAAQAIQQRYDSAQATAHYNQSQNGTVYNTFSPGTSPEDLIAGPIPESILAAKAQDAFDRANATLDAVTGYTKPTADVLTAQAALTNPNRPTQWVSDWLGNNARTTAETGNPLASLLPATAKAVWDSSVNLVASTGLVYPINDRAIDNPLSSPTTKALNTLKDFGNTALNAIVVGQTARALTVAETGAGAAGVARGVATDATLATANDLAKAFQGSEGLAARTEALASGDLNGIPPAVSGTVPPLPAERIAAGMSEAGRAARANALAHGDLKGIPQATSGTVPPSPSGRIVQGMSNAGRAASEEFVPNVGRDMNNPYLGNITTNGGEARPVITTYNPAQQDAINAYADARTAFADRWVGTGANLSEMQASSEYKALSQAASDLRATGLDPTPTGYRSVTTATPAKESGFTPTSAQQNAIKAYEDAKAAYSEKWAGKTNTPAALNSPESTALEKAGADLRATGIRPTSAGKYAPTTPVAPVSPSERMIAGMSKAGGVAPAGTVPPAVSAGAQSGGLIGRIAALVGTPPGKVLQTFLSSSSLVPGAGEATALARETNAAITIEDTLKYNAQRNQIIADAAQKFPINDITSTEGLKAASDRANYEAAQMNALDKSAYDALVKKGLQTTNVGQALKKLADNSESNRVRTNPLASGLENAINTARAKSAQSPPEPPDLGAFRPGAPENQALAFNYSPTGALTAKEQQAASRGIFSPFFVGPFSAGAFNILGQQPAFGQPTFFETTPSVIPSSPPVTENTASSITSPAPQQVIPVTLVTSPPSPSSANASPSAPNPIAQFIRNVLGINPSAAEPTPTTQPTQFVYKAKGTEEGLASGYNPITGCKSCGGTQLSTGGTYNPDAWEAAIKIPLGDKYGIASQGKTYSNPPGYGLLEAGDKKVIVKLNDVGPLCSTCIVDLNEQLSRYFKGQTANNMDHFPIKMTVLDGTNYTPGPLPENTVLVAQSEAPPSPATGSLPPAENVGAPTTPTPPKIITVQVPQSASVPTQTPPAAKTASTAPQPQKPTYVVEGDPNRVRFIKNPTVAPRTPTTEEMIKDFQDKGIPVVDLRSQYAHHWSARTQPIGYVFIHGDVLNGGELLKHCQGTTRCYSIIVGDGKGGTEDGVAYIIADNTEAPAHALGANPYSLGFVMPGADADTGVVPDATEKGKDTALKMIDVFANKYGWAITSHGNAQEHAGGGRMTYEGGPNLINAVFAGDFGGPSQNVAEATTPAPSPSAPEAPSTPPKIITIGEASPPATQPESPPTTASINPTETTVQTVAKITQQVIDAVLPGDKGVVPERSGLGNPPPQEAVQPVGSVAENQPTRAVNPDVVTLADNAAKAQANADLAQKAQASFNAFRIPAQKLSTILKNYFIKGQPMDPALSSTLNAVQKTLTPAKNAIAAAISADAYPADTQDAIAARWKSILTNTEQTLANRAKLMQAAKVDPSTAQGFDQAAFDAAKKKIQPAIDAGNAFNDILSAATKQVVAAADNAQKLADAAQTQTKKSPVPTTVIVSFNPVSPSLPGIDNAGVTIESSLTKILPISPQTIPLIVAQTIPTISQLPTLPLSANQPSTNLKAITDVPTSVVTAVKAVGQGIQERAAALLPALPTQTAPGAQGGLAQNAPAPTAPTTGSVTQPVQTPTPSNPTQPEYIFQIGPVSKTSAEIREEQILAQEAEDAIRRALGLEPLPSGSLPPVMPGSLTPEEIAILQQNFGEVPAGEVPEEMAPAQTTPPPIPVAINAMTKAMSAFGARTGANTATSLWARVGKSWWGRVVFGGLGITAGVIGYEALSPATCPADRVCTADNKPVGKGDQFDISNCSPDNQALAEKIVKNNVGTLPPCAKPYSAPTTTGSNPKTPPNAPPNKPPQTTSGNPRVPGTVPGGSTGNGGGVGGAGDILGSLQKMLGPLMQLLGLGQQQQQPTTLTAPVIPPAATDVISFSCDPATVLNAGTTTISWACSGNTTSRGDGFITGGVSSGSVQSVVNTSASSVSYGVSCGGGTERMCSVAVLHPQLTVSFTTSVTSGSDGRINWAAVDVLQCGVVGPGGVELGRAGASGYVETSPLTHSEQFAVVCSTAAGQAVSQLVTIKVVGDNSTPENAFIPQGYMGGNPQPVNSTGSNQQPTGTQTQPTPTGSAQNTPPTQAPPGTYLATDAQGNTIILCDPNASMDFFVSCLSNQRWNCQGQMACYPSDYSGPPVQ